MLQYNKDVEEFQGNENSDDDLIIEIYDAVKVDSETEIVFGHPTEDFDDLHVSKMLIEDGGVRYDMLDDGRVMVEMPLWFFRGASINCS